MQTRLPDWVWGLGLGLIVVIAVLGYFLLGGIVGGNSSTNICDSPLKSLGGASDISEKGFVAEDAALGHIVTFLQQGDENAAQNSFYTGDTHNFMHNADPAIRDKNPQLAKNLCNAVVKLEDDLSSRVPSSQLLGDMTTVRNYLRDAAVTLGFPRPG